MVKYAYLSDGMKSGAYHADGSGFIFRGSLKYARHYGPALRRWLTPDPLSEKYYTSSPYAYCAGDPVNLVDPDGARIEGGKEEWKNNKQIVEARRNKTQNQLQKMADKGIHTGARFNKLNKRLQSLNKTLATMQTLESSSQAYNLNNIGGEIGGVTYSNGVIDINYTGTLSNFVHELTHAGQFESGDLAFRATNGKTFVRDVYDEIEACEAQSAFEGIRNKYDNPIAIHSIMHNGKELYPESSFPDYHLRIDTPFSLVSKAYGQRVIYVEMSPFYSVVKDIYYKQ